MKLLTIFLILIGLSTKCFGVASSAELNTGHSRVNANLTIVANNTGWPPFYSASKPQNLCGDTIGYNKSSNKPPKASDCAALRDQLDANPGFWNITADPGRSDTFILIAGHGTCAFVMNPLDPSKDCLVGTEDTRDLLNDLVNDYSGYSISSTMGCTVNAATDWAIGHNYS